MDSKINSKSRHPIPAQGPTLEDAIDGFERIHAEGSTSLHCKPRDGLERITIFPKSRKDAQDPQALSTLRELIQNQYPRDETMPERVFDSMNHGNAWYGKQGMHVADLQTALDRGEAIQRWDEWLKKLALTKRVADFCDSRQIEDDSQRKLLENLVRQEIENAQRSWPLDVPQDKWNDKALETVAYVFKAKGIDELKGFFEEDGPQHLHLSEDKRELLTRGGSSLWVKAGHFLGSVFGTSAWQAFQQEKVGAAERLRLSIDRIYGAGMGERVLEAKWQQDRWKPKHDVEEAKLGELDRIARAQEHGVKADQLGELIQIAQDQTRFDEWIQLHHEKWIAQACRACGIKETYLHEGGRWGVLQTRIKEALSRLPNSANVFDVKRAVQVAVLQIALPENNLYIDGRSLFLRHGTFWNVKIGDAYRAFAAISARAPSLEGRSRKRLVKADAFERAVWIAEVCRRCGLDHDKLNQKENLKKVRKAIDAALRALPAKASPDQQQRAAHGAILFVACKANLPNLRIDDDRAGYKALMRSLFRDPAGTRYKDAIGDVYASFKLLAGRNEPVTEARYETTFAVRHWMRVNYERVRNEVVLTCGIPAKTFANEEVRQSVADFVEAHADRSPADALIAQRLPPLPGAQGVAESADADSEWINHAKERLDEECRRVLESQFERAAEVALLQVIRPPHHVDRDGTLQTSLLRADGDRRELSLGALRWALSKATSVDQFDSATTYFHSIQEKWQNTWLDDNLETTIDTVIEKCPGVAVKTLQGDEVRNVVKEALGWLPRFGPHRKLAKSEAARQRVAQGALIAEDLLARVRKAKKDGYSPQEQAKFKDLMQSLTLPGGSNHGHDLARAHKVLRPMANLGKPLTLASFERALRALRALRAYQDNDGIGRDGKRTDKSRKKIQEIEVSSSDRKHGVPFDPGTSRTVALPFGAGHGHNGWVDLHLDTVLASARKFCRRDNIAGEGSASRTVLDAIADLPGTTTHDQLTRAATGALIEKHLLDVMEKAEEDDVRYERPEENNRNEGKRDQLKQMIASIFRPHDPDSDLPIQPAYDSLFYFASRVDASLTLEEVRRQARPFEPVIPKQ